MVSHRVPGRRIPGIRVGVSGVMWGQQDGGIGTWNKSSMCKTTGSRAFETSPISRPSGHEIPYSPVSTGAESDCKFDEGVHTLEDGVPSMKHEVAVLATLSHDQEGFGIDEQDIVCHEGEVDSEPRETSGIPPDGVADEAEDIDIGFDAVYQLLEEPGPDVSPPAFLNHHLGHMHNTRKEVSSSPPQCSDNKEVIFLHSSEQEGLQFGSQQLGNDLCMLDESYTQDLSHPGAGLSSQYGSGSDFELLHPHAYQSSHLGILSDHQTNTSSFDVNPNEASWHSASRVLPKDEQISEHMDFVDAARSFEHTRSIQQQLHDIDRDRPSQTYGSVLATEGNSTGRINAADNSGMALPSSTSITVHKQVVSQSDVVDLTEDSDDDVITINKVTHPNHSGARVKRKLPEYFEVCNEKRLNTVRRSSEHLGVDVFDFKSQSSRPLILTAQQWPHSLSEDHIIKSRTLVSNQVPHRWNSSSTSHFPSRDRPGSYIDYNAQLVDRRSVQFSNDCVESIVDRETSLHLSTPYGLKMKKSLPITSEVTAATAAFTKIPLDGSKVEEATLDEGMLSVSLLKHQKVALAWMMKRELEGGPPGGILADDQGLGKTISTISLILKARPPMPEEAVEVSHPEAVTVQLHDDDDSQAAPQSQVGSLSAAGKKKSSLPPTLSSVTTGSGPQNTPEVVKVSSSRRRPAAGTLVVCPTSVLRQWAHELKEKVTESARLSVLTYHGSNRTRDPDVVAKYDVVLTTYSIVSMEVPKQPLPEEKGNEKKTSGGGDHDFPAPFRGASKAKIPKKATENGKKSRKNGKGRLVEGDNGSADSGPLARVHWFRVVLDEAQSIKNSRTQVARAACGLRSRRRWCLSGTPIQNSVDDLYSYFRFLGYFPFDSYKEFREHIKDPVTRSPAEGYKQLHMFLSKIMIRRTKATKMGGQPIVNLPPRIVTLKQAEFSEEERAFYDDLENESRKQFQDYAAAGTVQSNYVNILWMLLRLRQACDHPFLVKGRKSQGAQKVVLDSAKKLPAEKRMHLLSLLEANRDICSICNDLPDEAVICICTHVFCRQCISEQLATGDDTCCPLPKCRKSLNTSLVFTSASLRNCETGKGTGSATSLFPEQPQCEESAEDMDWKSSSKIDAVIDTLSALPAIDVIMENGRIVVHATTKDLDGEKLWDTSGTKIVNQGPLIGSSHEPDLQVKSEPLPIEQREPPSRAIESTQHMIMCATAVKVEKVESDQVDMGSNTETLTSYSSASVKEVKEEAVSCSIDSKQEPLKRQILKSTEKAIVFSQWTSMLDLLEVKLKQAHFNYRRLDGTMSVLARDRAVSEFKTKPEVTVIIMSLKAASLGLNMVAACHVLLLDVWWNPTTEDQAIDRAHRIGQTRTVNVSRFTVKNTVEDRILALQEKKRLMVASAFAGKDVGLHKGGLSAQDLQFLFDV